MGGGRPAVKGLTLKYVIELYKCIAEVWLWQYIIGEHDIWNKIIVINIWKSPTLIFYIPEVKDIDSSSD